MTHKFVILRNNKLETYDDYDKIPLDFSHIIEFKPQIPDGPHSEHQHHEIDQWNKKLQYLMDIERKKYASSH